MTRRRHPPTLPVRATKRQRLGPQGQHRNLKYDRDDHDHDQPTATPHTITVNIIGTDCPLTLSLKHAPRTVATWRKQYPLLGVTGSRLHSTITTDLADPTSPHDQQPPRHPHEDRVTPPSPPGTPSMVPAQRHTTPFAGPLRGCTWNSQAFFARNPWQHGARSSHALSLLS